MVGDEMGTKETESEKEEQDEWKRKKNDRKYAIKSHLIGRFSVNVPSSLSMSKNEEKRASRFYDLFVTLISFYVFADFGNL